MYAIHGPFPQYTAADGSPLEAGAIYFGVANKNPETNPITVYWDKAGTQPVAQPVKTSGGFIMRSGTPADVYVQSDYSINVRDSQNRLVYSKASAVENTGQYLPVLNVEDAVFGAVPGSLVDATASINAALAAAGAAGGGMVWCPADYLVNGTLNMQASGVALVGQNANKSKLTFANGANDSIYLQGLSAPGTYDCRISDLTLAHTGKTGGAAVRMYRANRVRLSRLVITDAWNGLDCKTVNDVTCEMLVGTNMLGAFGVKFWSLANGTERSDVLTLRDSVFNMGTHGGDGIVWDGFAHTLRLFGVGVLNAARGLLIQNTGGSPAYCPAFGEFVDLEVDGTTGQACRIEGGSTFTFSGCDLFNLATATGAIFEVLPDTSASFTNSFRISNTRIAGGQKEAFIFGARDLVMSACHVGGGNATGYEAVKLPAGAQDVTITGCAIGSFWGYPQKHNYGITIADPCYRVTVDNCSFYGCQTGEVLNNSTTQTIQLGTGINKTGIPNMLGSQWILRKDVDNGVADVRVKNAGTGANTIARHSWETVTANSFSVQDLHDNAGAPYWQQSHGSAITGEFFDCAKHVFRTAGAVQQFAIGSTLVGAADDAGAAAAGVPLYGYYHASGVVRQRLT